MLTKLIDDKWKPLYDKRDHCTPLPEVYPKVCGFRDINPSRRPVPRTFREYHEEQNRRYADMWEAYERRERFNADMKRKREEERWGWQN